jgi:hypothetical protein
VPSTAQTTEKLGTKGRFFASFQMFIAGNYVGGVRRLPKEAHFLFRNWLGGCVWPKKTQFFVSDATTNQLFTILT